MKKLFGLLIAACLMLPITAQAADVSGVYVAPKLVWGHTSYNIQDTGNTTFDLGKAKQGKLGGALAIGYDFHPNMGLPLRAEFEFAAYGKFNKEVFTEASAALMRNSVKTFFLNAYFDWHNSTAFTPYVGLGLGFAHVKADGLAYYDGNDVIFDYASHSKTNFAWNLGAGVSYAFTDNFSVDLGYRYARIGKAQTAAQEDGYRLKTKNMGIHNFMLGVRATF